MAVTTSYEFLITKTFYDVDVFDDLDASSVAAGYVYGGYGPGFGTSMATFNTGLSSNFGYATGRELALAGLKGTNAANYVAVTQDADSILYQIIGVNGVNVTGVIDIGDANSTKPDVAALSNGGFVIASQDAFTSPDKDIDLRFYNAAGTQVSSITIDSSLAADSDASVAVLDNGNVAVGWTRTIGAETEVWTAVYTSAGVVVKAPTLVDTSGTINDMVHLVSTAAGYAMLYRDNGNFFGQAAAAIQTFDVSGNLLNNTQVTNSFEYFDPQDITRLSNGMLVAAVRRGDGDTNWKLIDPANLSVLGDTNTTDFFDEDGATVLAAFGASRFASVTQVNASDFGGHVGEAKIREVTAYRKMQGDGANDTIIANNSMEHHLLGEGGNDKLTGGTFADLLEGGLGNDTLDGKGGNDELRGGAGNDSYVVDSEFDVIVEDVNGGTDKVTSNTYAYILSDNVENLTLGGGGLEGEGNALANTITGNGFDNYLYGLGGKDKLDGKGGADRMYGGDGDDTYYVDNAGDVVIEEAGAAAGKKDTVNVSFAGAFYTLADNVENGNLTSSGQQYLLGNELANTLTSKGNPNNVDQSHDMYGYGGKDTLKGGAGYDILNGGAGADTLTGGGGNDQFDFNVFETSANKDTIKDFSHADDLIVFYSGAFTGLAGAAVGHFLSETVAFQDMFRTGTSAADAEDRIIYDSATGNLWYDPDGINGAAQILVAVLSTKPTNVDASDFFIF